MHKTTKKGTLEEGLMQTLCSVSFVFHLKHADKWWRRRRWGTMVQNVQRKGDKGFNVNVKLSPSNRNIARQVEPLRNPLDLSNISISWRAHRKRSESNYRCITFKHSSGPIRLVLHNNSCANSYHSQSGVKQKQYCPPRSPCCLLDVTSM